MQPSHICDSHDIAWHELVITVYVILYFYIKYTTLQQLMIEQKSYFGKQLMMNTLL